MGAVFNRVTLSATGDTLIVSAGQNAGDAGWQLTFAGASWTGSVVLKQNTAPPGATVSLATVSYFNATTGALVAAGTAITSDGSFIVANTGLDLYLAYTHTAGTVQVTIGSAGGQFGGIAVAAADVAPGTFGAYAGSTGTYAFPGAVTAVGAITAGAASFTTGEFSGNLTVGSSAFVVTAATGTVAAGPIQSFGASAGVTVFARDLGGSSFQWYSPDTNSLILYHGGTIATFSGTGALAITGALTGVTTAALSNTLTITQATANTAIFARSGYSLTGTSAVGAETWAGTLNTSGVPTVLSYALTVTAAGAGSLYFNYLGGAAGATSLFKMTTAGALTLGLQPAFVAGDKYLVIDASGNIHVSALGPAS